MPSLDLVPASAQDYRRLAEKRLPRLLFDYVDGGAGDERTLADNIADFAALSLRQCVMRDVSKLDARTSLFGETLAMPLALAPIGMAGMTARRAEISAARAAAAAGIPFCLSTVSICSIEEVAQATARPFWFQLYMLKDRGHVRELLARARTAGVTTLVFTVDLAVVGVRRRDVRNGMGGGLSSLGRMRLALDYAAHAQWAYDVGVRGKPHVFGNLSQYVPGASSPAEFKTWIDSQVDASVTWKDIAELRREWSGKLVVKGVLSPDDARAAVDCGADAVIVSNHGGRQLDGVPSAIAMTPRVVDALAGRADVLMDGGVRSGADAVKALALGARAALIGRPWAWALAARGEKGLGALLRLFKTEIEVAMALTGAPRVADIGRDTLDMAPAAQVLRKGYAA
jgi:L-lactate dehydrogenase (cytochrome)